MADFRTKIDLGDNRQGIQRTYTITDLSGTTVFGTAYSALTSGVDTSTVVTTSTLTGITSTFSGNSTITNITFGDSRMVSASESLTSITSGTSGTTQVALGYDGKDSIIVDGNTVYLTYTGSTYDFYVTSIEEVATDTWTGETLSDTVSILSGSSLDYTSRPIWVDVLGITRTKKLILVDVPDPLTGATKVLARNSNGDVMEVELSAHTSGDYVSGATFNTADGVLTLTRVSGGTVTVDLDDRYSLTGHTHPLSALTDTELSASTDGYVLTYQSSTNQWIASGATGGGGALTLSGLTDTELSATTGGYVLAYNDSTQKWEAIPNVGGNDYVDSASFNTTDGVLTLNRLSGGTVTVDLDDRYSLTGHTHDSESNYVYDGSFNTTNGELTLTGLTGNTVVIDLDGRYLESSAFTDTNDYVISGSYNTTSGVVTLTTLTGGTISYGINGKYLDLSGGTMSNTNLVTNLNAELLGGIGSSFYSLTGHTHTLSALTDTELSATTDGYVLTYDSVTEKWIASGTTGGSSTISGSTDANVGVPADGEVLTWDTETARWIASGTTGGSSTISGSTDANVGVPTDGEVLTWDTETARWIASASTAGGATTLSGLTDTELSATTDGYVLTYDQNTQKWIASGATIPEWQTLAYTGSTGALAISSGNTIDLGFEFVDTGSGFTFGSHTNTLIVGGDIEMESAVTPGFEYYFPEQTGVIALVSDLGHITGATFNAGDGVITLTDLTGGTITVNIDNRYSLTGHTHGEFTIAYLPLSGGTMSNINLVTNLNAEYFDSKDSSQFSLTGHTHPYDNDVVTGSTFDNATGTLTLTTLTGDTMVTNFDGKYVDLSAYTDSNDYVISGNFNTSTGNVTLTTLTGDTVVYNLDGKYLETSGYTDSNNYVTGATFNINDGVLTLTDLSGGTVTVDLDDRYSLSGHTHAEYLTGFTDTNDYIVTAVFNESTGNLTLTSLTGNTIVENFDGKYLEISGYTDSNNYVTGATFNITDGVLTLTTLTGDTVTVDLDDRYSLTGHTHATDNTDDFLTGATFNTTDGVITMTLQSGSTVTVDIDGRYSVTGHTHDADNDYVVTSDFDNSTGNLTLTTLTGTTMITNFDGKYVEISGYTDSNNYVTGATFNINDGVLTLTHLTGSTVTVDLDDRYSLTGHTHVADNDYVVSGSFNTGSGVVTLTTLTGGTVNYGLDGKYVELSAYTNTLSALTDTNVGVPTDGEVLTWDTETARWIASGTTGGSSTISGSTDANVGVPSDGEVLTWDTETARWIASASTAGGATTLTGLTDTELSATTDGYVLTYDQNTQKWIASGSTGGIAEWQTLAYTGSTGALAISSGNTIDLGFEFVDTGSGFTFGSHTNTLIVGGDIEMESAVTPGFEYYFPEQTGVIALVSDLGHVTGATFNTGDGILTLTDLTGGTITVDLDDRYSFTGHTHGEFTIAYLPLSGGTMSNINLVTNLNAEYFDSKDSSQFSLTGHTHPTDNTDDFLTGATFNTGSGVITMTLQSGSTVSVGLDGKYLEISAYTDSNDYVVTSSFDNATGTLTLTTLTGDTMVTNFDGKYVELSAYTDSNDYVTGATFNINDGVLTLTTLTGDTVTVDLDNRYSLTGHTHVADNDYVVTGSFNTASGVVTLTTLTGGTVNYGLDGKYLDLSAYTDSVNYIYDGSFNTTDGVLTLTGLTGNTVTIDLDGRYSETTHNHALSGLTDTNVGVPTDGEVLTWDTETARWVASGTTGGSSTISGSTDANVGVPTDGEVLTWDTETARWIASGTTGGGGATNLSGLTDTELSATTDGYVLTYDQNTQKWIASGSTGGVAEWQTLAYTGSTGALAISSGNTVDLGWEFVDTISGFTFGSHTNTLIVGGDIEMESAVTPGFEYYFPEQTGTIALVTDLGHITGATFNTGDGVITLTDLTGGTITVDIDGRYSVTGHTHASDNTDDFLTGATFNTGSGVVTMTLQSGSTVSVGLDGKYLDLSAYTDYNDYVISGNFDTGTGDVTLTTLTGDTIVYNLDGKYLESSGFTDSNNYVTGATFNTTDGVLTLTHLTGSTVTVDLDNRYSLTGHTHPNYDYDAHTGDTNNPHNTTLSGLTDANVGVPTDGEVLTWDTETARWIASGTTGGSSTISGSTDANVGVPTDGEVLTWDTETARWIASGTTGGSTTLTGLTDTELSATTDGFILTYQASTQQWIASGATGGGGGATTLTGLTDTELSAVTDGYILTYDGVTDKWVASGNTILAPQTLSFTGSTGDLEISDGNIINLGFIFEPIAGGFNFGTSADTLTITGDIELNAADTPGFEYYFPEKTGIIALASWETITATTYTSIDSGKYIAFSASRVVFSMPITNNPESVRVTGKGVGGWQVDVPSGWTFTFVDEVITDNIQSTEMSDSVELICTGNNAYHVISSTGNITFNNL